MCYWPPLCAANCVHNWGDALSPETIEVTTVTPLICVPSSRSAWNYLFGLQVHIRMFHLINPGMRCVHAAVSHWGSGALYRIHSGGLPEYGRNAGSMGVEYTGLP